MQQFVGESVLELVSNNVQSWRKIKDLNWFQMMQ